MKSNYEVRAQRFIRQIASYLESIPTHDRRVLAIDRFNRDYNRKVFYTHGMTRYVLITSDYVVKVDCAVTRWGDCEDETEVYEEAKQDGFEYLFAKITRYDYNGTAFYIMPRINGVGKTPYDADKYLTREEKDWVNDHVFDLHNRNYGWKDGHVVIFDYAAQRQSELTVPAANCIQYTLNLGVDFWQKFVYNIIVPREEKRMGTKGKTSPNNPCHRLLTSEF